MKCTAFLLVDIGNTRLKWSVAAIRVSDPRFAIPIPPESGEISTAEVTPDFIQELKKKFSGHHLILASVVPKLVPPFCRAFKRAFHLVTAESTALGLRFDYPNPSEIGADRLAAAVAVNAEGLWPAIIVASGTATAFTALDAKGRLCGGVIAPGMEAQLSALLGATAQLPATTLQAPQRFLAKSTQEAIRAGLLLNFRGGVKEIIHQLSKDLSGFRKPQIVVTGGNAPYLAGIPGLRVKLRPLLVFEGLLIIGRRLYSTNP